MSTRGKGRSYSVAQVNRFLYNLMASEPFLEHITVEGEVSNLTYHRSGHIYFDLKDESGKLSCAMFKGSRGGLTYRMAEGDKVAATGSVGVYVKGGSYQLIATHIEENGAGDLYQRFLQLKKELEEMGMFDPSYKRPLPKMVRTLGIVTAPTGAAVRDIIRIATRRNPGIHIILYPALVQGEGAVASICDGIRALDAYGVDAMIVGRGGGSIEDLWAFNEELVARAIFECATPVISAVGHQTDVTIADFVADQRAATPSEAAELAVCDVGELLRLLATDQRRLTRAMIHRLHEVAQRTDHAERRLVAAHPAKQCENRRRYLALCQERLREAITRHSTEVRHRIALDAERLSAHSPAKRLAAGYAFVTDASGQRIKSVRELTQGDVLDARLMDGRIQAEVKQIEVFSNE